MLYWRAHEWAGGGGANAHTFINVMLPTFVFYFLGMLYWQTTKLYWRAHEWAGGGGANANRYERNSY